MSIYSNVTEQDLINLRKLAEQQKNQRAAKIENRYLKQTPDIELAENLSPITKKFDEVKESTQKLRDVIKESQPETLQLANEKHSTTTQSRSFATALILVVMSPVVMDFPRYLSLVSMKSSLVRLHDTPAAALMQSQSQFRNAIRPHEVVKK